MQAWLKVGAQGGTCGVQGLGFRALGLGFRVLGLVCWVCALGLRL